MSLKQLTQKAQSEVQQLRRYKFSLEAVERVLSLSVNWNKTDAHNISSHLAELEFLHPKNSQTDIILAQTMQHKLNVEYRKLQVVTLRNRLQRLQDCISSLSGVYSAEMNTDGRSKVANRVGDSAAHDNDADSQELSPSKSSWLIKSRLCAIPGFKTPQKLPIKAPVHSFSASKAGATAIEDLNYGFNKTIRSPRPAEAGSHRGRAIARSIRRSKELMKSDGVNDFRSTAAHSLATDILKQGLDPPTLLQKSSMALPHYLGAISHLVAQKARSRSNVKDKHT